MRTTIRFEEVYQAALEACRKNQRLPLLRRDHDILALVAWAARTAGGDQLLVDDVHRGLVELVEDLHGLPLNKEEQEDAADMAELARLTGATGQDGWVVFITGALNRLRGIEPSLTPRKPVQRVVVAEVEVKCESTAKPRCAADAPVEGAIDEGDPEKAPVHGTYNRYISRVYKCRCEPCHQAYLEYRRAQREAKRHADCIVPGTDVHPNQQDDAPARVDGNDPGVGGTVDAGTEPVGAPVRPATDAQAEADGVSGGRERAEYERYQSGRAHHAQVDDGATASEPRPRGSNPSRNGRCWCGSGRKYKRCHLKADRSKENDNATMACS